jgi:hypothetical protein
VTFLLFLSDICRSKVGSLMSKKTLTITYFRSSPFIYPLNSFNKRFNEFYLTDLSIYLYWSIEEGGGEGQKEKKNNKTPSAMDCELCLIGE